jgi:hypothetical protein
MRLHETLARFADIIRSYQIVRYELAVPHTRLKLNITFVAGSELYVREIVLDSQHRKYALHWQESSGHLIARWDNAAHWPEIETSSAIEVENI